jgi:hypothetical protein
MKPQLNRINVLARKHIVDDHGDTNANDPDNNAFLIYQTSNNKWVDKTLESSGQYQTGSETFTFSSGVWATASYNINVKWYKSGNLISLYFPETVKNTKVAILTDHIYSLSVPSFLSPQKSAPYFVIKCVNGSFDTTGVVQISEKCINIFNGAIDQPFSSGGSSFAGFRSFSITYIGYSNLCLPSESYIAVPDPTIVPAFQYSNANSLMRVNSTLNNLEEVGAQLTIPAANQLQLTSGSSDIIFKSDTIIDQNLEKTANVQFATVNCTGKLTVGGLIDPSGLELTPVDANPGAIPQNTLWLDSDNSNILKKNSNPIILGPTSSTDNALIKFDGTTGGLIKNTGVILDNSNNLSCLTSFAIGTTPIINSISCDSSFSSENDTSICTTKAIKSFVNTKYANSSISNSTADNQIAIYNGASTNALQSSIVTISDVGGISGVSSLSIGTTPIISSISVDSSFSSENDTSLCTTKAIKSFVNNKIGGNIGVGIDNYLVRYNGTNSLEPAPSISIDDNDNLKDVNDLECNTIKTDVITQKTINVGVTVSGNLNKNGCISLVAQTSNNISDGNCDIWNYTGNILRLNSDNILLCNTNEVLDNSIPRFDGTISNKVQSSSILIDDLNNITGINNIEINGQNVTNISTDTALSSNSDNYIPSEKAIKSYVDGKFSSGNASVTFSGPCVNTDITIYYSIVNGFVNLYIPSFSANGNSSASPMQSTAIPSVIRPASEQSAYIYALDSGNHQSAYCIIRTTGVISISRLQLSGSNIVYSNFQSANTVNGFGVVHSRVITYKL